VKHKHHDVTSALKRMNVYFVVYVADSECVCLRVDHEWKTMAREPDPAHTIFCTYFRVNVGTRMYTSLGKRKYAGGKLFILKQQHFFCECTSGTFRNTNFSNAARSGVWFPTVVLHVNFKFSS
jgi:hypothetical protein